MTKGGAMGGYRSEVAVIPDIRLSFTILVNSEQFLSELTKMIVTNILDALLPDLDAAYSPSAEAPLPRNASMYVGEYRDRWNSVVSIRSGIHYNSSSPVLFMRINYGGNNYYDSLLRQSTDASDPTVLQLTSMERDGWGCSNEEITGYDGEFALFEFDPSTRLPSTVTFPGFNYGAIFTRVT